MEMDILVINPGVGGAPSGDPMGKLAELPSAPAPSSVPAAATGARGWGTE